MRTYIGCCSSGRVLLRASAMLTLAGLLFVSSADVALAANRFWVGASSTDVLRWEDTGNWSATSGGAGGATIPAGTDVAIFNRNSGGIGVGASSGIRIRSVVNILGLELNSAYTGSLLQGTGAITIGTSGIIIGSGRFIGGNASLSTSGSYTQTGGIVTGVMSTFSLSGSLAITKGSNSAYSTFTNTGTLLFSGKADQNFTVGANVTKTFKNLTIRNAGGGTSDDIVTNVNGGLFLSGALVITSGNLDLATNSVAMVVDRGITLADAAQATLTTDSNVTASGTILVNDAATITVSAGTWTLNDDGDQSVDLDGQSLYNLTINNTGGGTNDDVTIDGGTLSVLNDLTVTLGNLDTTTNSLTLNVDDDITVANAAQATVAYGTLTAGGDITLNPSGSFTQTAGTTATLDGSSQTLSGALTFYNLTKGLSSSTNDTLTFAANVLVTVTNSFDLHGKNGASTLSLRSSQSGNQWKLSSPSNISVGDLDVKDGFIINAENSITCRVSCTDSGNNRNWVFIATVTSTDSSGSTGGASGSGGGGRRGGGGGSVVSTPKPPVKVTPPAKGGPDKKATVKPNAAEQKAARIAKISAMKAKAASRAAARKKK